MDIEHPTAPCIWCCHTTLWNINARKQAISDKLQGSVATYLRCGGVVNNQIKNGLLMSVRLKFFLKSVNIWQSYKQERRLANTLLKDEVSARDSHVFARNFARYSPIIIFFVTLRLTNEPVLIWLLTTSPHLKCTATLPCNLSLMACFAEQHMPGSVGFLICL